MIAKRIAIRNPRKSSFSGLVKYITSGLGQGERVGEIRITNCHGEHPSWAALEAEHVQALNTRAESDKTYHLILSFPEQDNPTPEIIHAIEDRICAALGYADHQRVSAIHHDTDNLHMHLAINKVHRKRYTIHEPYYDKKTLGKLCIALEAEFGLTPINHIPHHTAGETKALDMEHAAGFESLIGWVKRDCLPDLLASTSWEELHRALSKRGLELQSRGNGFVIINAQGTAAKASSISRELSRPALEKKLGEYRPASIKAQSQAGHHKLGPVASKSDTSRLWAQYQTEKVQQKNWQVLQKQNLKLDREQRIGKAKKMARAKRSAIRLTRGTLAKRLLYKSVSNTLLQNIQSINQQYQHKRQEIYAKSKKFAWYDWLKLKAKEGNEDALGVLRSRYVRQAANSNSMGSAGVAIPKTPFQAGAKIQSVTKMGTVIYQVAQTTIRDDGSILRLKEGVSHAGIEAALNMAVERFGAKLAVNGSERFRKEAVEVAVHAKINLVFADNDMERRRKTLLSTALPDRQQSKRGGDATAYIQERNHSRKKTFDILEHRLYTGTDSGILSYGGVRQMNNTTLMLLQKNNQILVLPIDSKTAYRVRQIKVGNPLEITSLGAIRSISRRR